MKDRTDLRQDLVLSRLAHRSSNSSKLDSWVGGMVIVQKMAVLSPRELRTEVSDRTSFRSAWQADQTDDKLICPMPRKVTSVSFSTAESMKPFWHPRSVPPSLDCEASHEILEIFCRKSPYTNVTNFGCSPPFFVGSPPSRAGNPIVRDAEFSRSSLAASSMHGDAIEQDMEILTKQSSPSLPIPIIQTKSAVSTPPTYRASPCVRVEGFECPAHTFECSSRETRRSVPAIA